MIRYDCHTHTAWSSDSKTEAREQIEAAIRLELEGICITDHMDYDYPDESINGYSFTFDPQAYCEDITALKEEYADRISVLMGIELGLRNEAEVQKDMEARYRALTERYPFDFVIGSTHCLKMQDPVYDRYWAGRSVQAGVREYFEAVLDNIRSYDCYDTCAHLDYLVRYIPDKELEGSLFTGPTSYKPSEYADIVDAILTELIRRNKALECNTAGFKYGLGFMHPHQEILKRYKALGGDMLTIGSDGHRPEHVAYSFKEACDALRGLGFKHYLVYEARTPIGFVLY